VLEATVIARAKAKALAAKVRARVVRVKVLVARAKVLAEARIKEALELKIIEALLAPARRVPARRVPVRKALALVVTNVDQVKLDKVLPAVVKRLTLPRKLLQLVPRQQQLKPSLLLKL